MTSVILAPIADTYVDSGSPDTAASQAGNVAKLRVGYDGRSGTTEYQSWTRFSLSGIPSGSTINSATLKTRVYYSKTIEYNGQTIGVYRSTDITWTESLTWNTASSPAGAYTDTVYMNADFGVDYNFNVTSDVAAALISGGISLVIKVENTGVFSDFYYWNMQDADYTVGPPAQSRPQLIIDYTAAANAHNPYFNRYIGGM